MDKNRSSSSSSFHSLTFFTGLYIDLSPIIQAITTDDQDKEQEDTLAVEAARPSLYVPTQSADPKFFHPVADTTRTTTMIPEQVIKDQGAANLTDALKSVPNVGAFFAGGNDDSSTGDAVYMRGADTSNNIYIDDIHNIGSITRGAFNTEWAGVIEGPSGTDYGRSAPTGSISMISKQPRTDSEIDVSASVDSAWFRRGMLDINQVIGETTATCLNLMDEKTYDTGRDNVKDECYGVAPSLAFDSGAENRLHLNYLHVAQHNTPNDSIPTIDLPGYSAPSVGASVLDHSGKANTHNFYGTNPNYDDSTTDTVTVCFEHDLNDSTTIRNTTRWSRIKQNYLMTAVMGGASNITQPINNAGSWIWSRLANTRGTSNKILINQTNLISTFCTGSIGHDISTDVELTRETQTNYGMAPIIPPPVDIYHPDSNVNIGGLSRNGTNANGQMNTLGAYAFDTLRIAREFELSDSIRLDNYHTEYDSATVCGASDHGAVAYPTGVIKGSPVAAVNTAKSGNLVNWKADALYHLTNSGSVYIDYTVFQQLPSGSNFALAQGGNGNSTDRTDPKPQKAKASEIGIK